MRSRIPPQNLHNYVTKGGTSWIILYCPWGGRYSNPRYWVGILIYTYTRASVPYYGVTRYHSTT